MQNSVNLRAFPPLGEPKGVCVSVLQKTFLITVQTTQQSPS